MKNLLFALLTIISISAFSQGSLPLPYPYQNVGVPPGPVDFYYRKTVKSPYANTPYTSLTQAKSILKPSVRYTGMTFFVMSSTDTTEYWMRRDTTWVHVEKKLTGSSGGSGWALSGTTNLTGDALVTSANDVALEQVVGSGYSTKMTISETASQVGDLGFNANFTAPSGPFGSANNNLYLDKYGVTLKASGSSQTITLDASGSTNPIIGINGAVTLSFSPPIADTTGFILGRRTSDGKLIRIHKSSLGGGGGGLTSITDDPFHYPANGDTNDQFGGKTSGNLKSIFGAYTLPVISVTNKLVIDGNSNGYGSLLADTSKRYGSVMRSILGSANYGYRNFSVPGETTLQMTARQSTTNAAFDAGKTHNYLMAFEIENDAFINTSTTYTNLYNHMATWYTAAKAAGFYTIALTAPTRAYYGQTLSTMLSVNNKILKADSLLRATTTSYDTLLDIFKLPRLSNNRASVGYTYEDTHIQPSGHDDIAHAGVSIIRKKLGQQDYTPPHFASWDGNTAGKSMIFGAKDFYPIGFITDGKVRAEVQTNGTFAINGNISPPDATNDARYRFGVSQNQAIGLMVTPGLTAKYTSDILSALTIQPAFFDVNGKTGVLCDMLRLNKYKSNGYGINVLRIDSAGRMTHTPSFTASGSTDYASAFGSVVTGPSSGNYTQNSFNGTYKFNANSQNHIFYDFAPNLIRGSFTSPAEIVLNVNSGSGATSSDIAIKVNAAEGVGVDLSNHGGTTTAVNIISSSSGTGILSLMTDPSARAGIFFKTSGTTDVNIIRTQSSSNASGLLDLQSFERTSNSQVSGTGISNHILLKSNADNGVRAVQEDYFWKDNVDGSENASVRWNVVTRGTLSEAMRLETGKLSIGTGSPAALLDIKPGGSAAGSAPLKLNYNSITTTGASGTGTVSTITFASQPKIPFEVGGTVTISGVTPSGYNGTYTVTAATLIAVSYANTTTGSQTVAGIAETGMLTTPEAGAIERDKNHIYFTDASATRFQLDQQSGGGGSGTVTTVTGSAPIVITSTPTTTPNVTISDAVANGSGKGAATFEAADFNSSAGDISIDYTNAQKATGSVPGFLTAADWTTFNGKQATLVSGTNIKTINSTSLLGSGDITISGGGITNSAANTELMQSDGTNAVSSKIFATSAGNITLGDGTTTGPYSISAASTSALVLNGISSVTLGSDNINLGTSTSSTVAVVARGGTNVNLTFSSKGTGNIRFPQFAGNGAGFMAIDNSGNSSWSNTLPSATTATTQTAGDNSTKVATTAYVDGLTLPAADATHDGYLTSSNFNLFSSKKTYYTGSFSGAGTATTTFTVTIGTTQANTSYHVVASPTSALSAAVFYINNKTTTTFDVVYLAGLTGTISFDWIVTP